MKSISVSLAVTGGAGVNVIDVITVVTPFTFDRTPLATRSSDYRGVSFSTFREAGKGQFYFMISAVDCCWNTWGDEDGAPN